MPWQLQNDRPIYLQLVEILQLRIITGQYAPGSRLPAVRDLAQEAAVNPNTMQKALNELEADGLTYTQRTAGRYVTEDTDRIEGVRQRLAAAKAQTFLKQIEQLGYAPQEITALVTAILQKEDV